LAVQPIIAGGRLPALEELSGRRPSRRVPRTLALRAVMQPVSVGWRLLLLLLLLLP